MVFLGNIFHVLPFRFNAASTRGELLYDRFQSAEWRKVFEPNNKSDGPNIFVTV